jgi:hypothetical protein
VNSNVTNAYLKLPGYDLQPELRKGRNDTTNGIGGGLLVSVRDEPVILSMDNNLAVGQ